VFSVLTRAGRTPPSRGEGENPFDPSTGPVPGVIVTKTAAAPAAGAARAETLSYKRLLQTGRRGTESPCGGSCGIFSCRMKSFPWQRGKIPHLIKRINFYLFYHFLRPVRSKSVRPRRSTMGPGADFAAPTSVPPTTLGPALPTRHAGPGRLLGSPPPRSSPRGEAACVRARGDRIGAPGSGGWLSARPRAIELEHSLARRPPSIRVRGNPVRSGSRRPVRANAQS
jgi:hypothetical protein